MMKFIKLKSETFGQVNFFVRKLLSGKFALYAQIPCEDSRWRRVRDQDGETLVEFETVQDALSHARTIA